MTDTCGTRHQPADRIWTCETELELSSFTLRRAFPRHFHPETIVAVLVEGSEALNIDGQWHTAGRGSVVLIEPLRAHWNAPIDAAGARYRGFYVASSLFERVGIPSPRRLRSHLLQDPRIARRLVELHLSIERGEDAGGAEGAARELAAVLAIVGEMDDRPAPIPAVSEAASLLSRIGGERRTWPVISHELGYSPAHLARQFQRWYRMAPHAYHTQFRVAHAKELLRAGQALTRVAASCRYVDQSHMTREFARYVGMTPGAFALGQKTTIRM